MTSDLERDLQMAKDLLSILQRNRRGGSTTMLTLGSWAMANDLPTRERLLQSLSKVKPSDPVVIVTTEEQARVVYGRAHVKAYGLMGDALHKLLGRSPSPVAVDNGLLELLLDRLITHLSREQEAQEELTILKQRIRQLAAGF